MGHYKSDLRDIEFNLFEFLDTGSDALGEGEIRQILRTLDKLAAKEIADSFEDGDRNPPTIGPDGTPVLPASIKAAVKAFQGGDWHRLALAEDMGGFGAPQTVAWAALELMLGANPAAGFYLFDTFISGVIGTEGTPEQKALFFPRYADEGWSAAMVLTEPDAGSDVGASRTSARHLHDDVWAIKGIKRFITNGDHDGAENILHLVLARPEGAVTGTKGLSMFIVPKFWVNEDGSLGERNAMRCVGLEHKMGLKASVTCEMEYGGDGVCRGLLVGGVHDGIRQMFNVIEGARMSIGFKSLAGATQGYLNALQYAQERVQGPDLAQAAKKDSPRVAIIRHPDVRRMLMEQKAHIHGMRALCYYVADLGWKLQAGGGYGEDKILGRMVDLLLPLVKGYNSERAFTLLSTA